MFAESSQPFPLQALRYIDHLMATAPCRMVLLEHNRTSLQAIASGLKNIKVLLYHIS